MTICWWASAEDAAHAAEFQQQWTNRVRCSSYAWRRLAGHGESGAKLEDREGQQGLALKLGLLSPTLMHLDGAGSCPGLGEQHDLLSQGQAHAALPRRGA